MNMAALEGFRELLHQLLSNDCIDFLGITEKLLIHRSVRPDALEWLRGLGFVHLFTASGIHLYLLADGAEAFVRAFCLRSGMISIPTGLRLTRALGLVFWGAIWAISDFRSGLLRALLLVIFRIFGRAAGLKWRLFAPLLLALGADILAEMLTFFIRPETPSSWSARLHYGLAVGGGLVGYEWARSRGKSHVLQHVALAWSSWVFTAILQLFTEGSVSPWTAMLSLLTIPVISYAVYPLLILSVFALALTPSGSTAEAIVSRTLQWVSVLWNHVIHSLGVFIDANGGWMEIPPGRALLALWMALLLSLVLGFRPRSEQESAAIGDEDLARHPRGLRAQKELNH